MNELGRNLLGDAIPNNKVLDPVVSDKKIFHIFPIQAHLKHVTSGEGLFLAQDYNLNTLGRCLLGDAKHQISIVWAFCFQTSRFLHVFTM